MIPKESFVLNEFLCNGKGKNQILSILFHFTNHSCLHWLELTFTLIMKTCTYCVLFGLDWIYYRSLVLPPLFTFHYFKLSHTVRPLLVIIITVNSSKLPFTFTSCTRIFHWFQLTFTFLSLTTHFHVLLFETHSHFSLSEIRLLQN